MLHCRKRLPKNRKITIIFTKRKHNKVVKYLINIIIRNPNLETREFHKMPKKLLK